MIHIFKRNIYNNFNRAYLGLSYKKYIYPLKNQNKKVSKIPKYLDVTLEELIQNKKNINRMHRLVYKKQNVILIS
tara:strand:+ start:503 stop:727 length:225 start_codon:yes stop_codon:yes gene_type:complete